jgi:hypothetical protein
MTYLWRSIESTAVNDRARSAGGVVERVSGGMREKEALRSFLASSVGSQFV